MSLPISIRPEFRTLRSIFSLAIALSPAILFGQGSDAVPNLCGQHHRGRCHRNGRKLHQPAEGICTLRDALAAANAVTESNITFAPTVFLDTNSAAANTITLANGTLNIPSGATITGLTSGSGAPLTNLVTVSGNNATTVFTVASGVTGAAITNLNITDGGNSQAQYAYGGGISNSGELTVTGSTFSGNSAFNPATPGYGSGGGAIYNTNSGVLTVTSSIFAGNSSNEGGALFTTGALTVSSSTFTGNSGDGAAILAICGADTCSAEFPKVMVANSTFSGNSGVAIYMLYGELTVSGSTFSGNSDGAISSNDGALQIENSTVSGNFVGTNGTGGGIGVFNSTFNIANSIVEGNTVGLGGSYPDISIDSSSTLNDLGGNLINTSASAAVLSPNLSPLGNYGGPTQTMLPQPGSLAICGGIAANIPAGVTTDQRGYPIKNTTYPGYSSSTPCVDSGAVQTNYAMAITTQPPANATVNEAIAPAPVVTLTESGNMAGRATGMVRMTDSSDALTGTTSEGLSSGATTFPDLILAADASDDIFTAWLGLNPMLNIAAQASVVVSTATGPAPAIMLSPTPGAATILGTSNIQFQWSRGVDVTSYELLIGTSGVGSSNILNTGVIGTTSYTLSTLPYNGVTVYVRLASLMINGAWQREDYQYTESVKFSVVVNTTADDAAGTASNCTGSPEGICTLRDALAAANAVTGSNITFAPTVFLASNSTAANTITLSNGTLNIPSGATITGLPGSSATLTNLVTVSGNNATTVFTVASGVTGAVIANLNIIDGNSANGGGINNAGTLRVTASSFNLNNAANSGGAIYSDGTMTVVDSSISENVSQEFGGGISNDGTMTVMGSTFYGNFAGNGENALGAGGGIYDDGTLTVTGSTFSQNQTLCQAPQRPMYSPCQWNGPAIYYTVDGVVVVNNSIMTQDTFRDGGVGGGTYPDSPYYYPGTGDIFDQDGTQVNLAPIGNYGGSTPTMLPLPGSTAICGGLAANIPAGVTTDQRGYPIKNTTYPGYSSSTPCVDSGAVQTNYAMAFTTQPPANAIVDVAIRLHRWSRLPRAAIWPARSQAR